MKILVTAGPTREYIDAVRYLSNPSSGKMGFETAAAAVAAGHDTTLVTGPVDLPNMEGANIVGIICAEEMARECLSRFDDCDAVIMTAAVCDYTPAARTDGKMKKTGQKFSLELVPTTDILAEMGKRKRRQVLVGFALEVAQPRENALEKLKRKNLDFIVLNSPASFAEENISCEIIDRLGKGISCKNISKRSLAEKILELIEKARSGNT